MLQRPPNTLVEGGERWWTRWSRLARGPRRGPRPEKKFRPAENRLRRPPGAPELWISPGGALPGPHGVLQRRALALQRGSNRGKSAGQGPKTTPDRCFRSCPTRDRPLPSKRETVRTSRTYEHQAVGKHMSTSQRIEAVRPLRRALPVAVQAAVAGPETAGQPAFPPASQIANTDGRR